MFGFPGLTDEEERKIAELLKSVAEVPVDSRIIDRAIVIRKAIRIKVPDAIIAATALEKECFLATRNLEDFRGIANLGIVDPHAI